MFSFSMFDKVAEDADVPQGVVLPPVLADGFGQNWFGEGDLVYKVVEGFGEDFAIDAIVQHRNTYITDIDIKDMIENHVTSIRLPVGWWAFTSESKSSFEKVITDPAHEKMKFVTITNKFLRETIERFVDAGLDVLLDVHAFPGGSSQGSYSGIFPEEPMFWKDEGLQSSGLTIVQNLCDFYNTLDKDIKQGVTGITIMNEPAHGLSNEESLTMQSWLPKAIDIYRQNVILKGNNSTIAPPKVRKEK